MLQVTRDGIQLCVFQLKILAQFYVKDYYFLLTDDAITERKGSLFFQEIHLIFIQVRISD